MNFLQWKMAKNKSQLIAPFLKQPLDEGMCVAAVWTLIIPVFYQSQFGFEISGLLIPVIDRCLQCCHSDILYWFLLIQGLPKLRLLRGLYPPGILPSSEPHRLHR